MSTASRSGDAKRRVVTRWRPKPITIIITLAVLGLVIIAMSLVLLGIWPPKSETTETLKPGSPYASGVKFEVVGTPAASTVQSTRVVVAQATKSVITNTLTTITLTVVITNNVMQSQAPAPAADTATPVPNAPTYTPVPAGTPLPTSTASPAKIINLSIKVLFYSAPKSKSDKRLVGSGVGYYYNAQGLAPGDSATVQVVSSDVEGFDTGCSECYDIYPDNLLTDKDPVKIASPTP